ncbi:cytochrome c oxidase assembly factor 10 [Megachile rotundata]|uniref:cytochrome c oxidase assembly factor 10 n=1 Tax=Megachile rotundata TaxID=143995 RepID=UPI000258E0AF|nr:PREDICTED: protoheme IX farnesyltransferase, mitochondrial [Megachile rotundata]XP_012140227.1 PREDICTED: protoheme IX farnesyltransferase, mitochondrial [Megachile rotundata]XP_012140228.1 PREDICTED: protoheme IX farnesyltransferase, mitochondrial [Megachile rotundata]XP_012140229.1 PREDICTED: protoheme IX farnesyltransferase, mitochondrial [Megachile rotundata]XP_012140230.1 PREDICTED: protoheme IX farnesyltransferase, mitochondrial [Megachile rotundata]
MVFVLCSIRISRNICLSSLKLSTVKHSTNATSTAHKLSATQTQQKIIPDTKSLRGRTASVNLIDSVHPKAATRVSDGVGKEARSKEEQEWRYLELDSSKLQKHCFMLSKIRLTSLVVITTMGGYAIAPGAFDISTFLACSVGTGLVSATANAINQFFEVPFDAQMSRTKNRVLVRGHLTPGHAIIFATVSGVSGLLLLYSQVNGLTAALGAANLILYTLVYTPMKRISILNTWVGSVVGAIPPLMGWAACVGDVMSPGAWIMSGLLYAWQFPHFNALSWNLRPDYSRAGYRMMAVTNPKLCRDTALRYTGILTGLCYLAPALDVTNWWFAAASTPLNVYFLYLAWKFHQHSDSGTSRKLFRFSLIHLPLLMVFMLLSKKHWYGDKKETGSVLQEEKENNVHRILYKLITPSSTS